MDTGNAKQETGENEETLPSYPIRPICRSGLVQASLFTSGNNVGDNTMAKYGCAASALALHNGRLALVMLSLNRLATDGTTGGVPLEGPKTSFTVPHPHYHGQTADGSPCVLGSCNGH